MMHFRYGVLILAVLVLLFPAALPAQWHQTAGPEGGFVMSLLSADSGLFAATYGGGLFRSTDGTRWSASDSGLPNYNCTALTRLDDTLFAGTTGSIYRSTDWGRTWAASGTGISSGYIRTLASFDGRLYAGTVSGLFASLDGGRSWTRIGYSGVNIQAVTAFGSFVFGAAGGVGVVRTSDSGAHWDTVNTGISSTYTNGLGYDGTLLWAVNGSGIYSSADSGAHWTLSHSGTGAQCVTIRQMPSDTPVVYIGSYGKIDMTTDRGLHWSSSAPLQNQTAYCVAVGGSGIFAGTTAGVSRSVDAGGSWTQMNKGLIGTDVSAMIPLADGRLIAGTMGSGIALSSNAGMSWTTTYPAGNIWSLCAANGLIFAGGSSSVLVSSDTGTTWAPLSGSPGTNIYSLAVTDSALIAGTSSGTYRSLDTGKTWSAVTGLTGGIVNAFYRLDSMLLAGTNSGGMYRSSNGGKTWDTSSTGLPGMSIYNIASDGYRIYLASSQGVYSSEDKGKTWASLNTGLPSGNVLGLAAAGTSLFAGTQSYGAWTVPVYGGSWVDLSGDLPSKQIRRLAIQHDTLYAGTMGNGIWLRKVYLGGDAVNFHDEKLPGFALAQNYPNPFNPTTGVRFQVTGVSDVKITVYDVLGREVATLVNERKQPGSYEVRFDGTGLASGVYIYRMTAGSFSQARTMLLIK